MTAEVYLRPQHTKPSNCSLAVYKLLKKRAEAAGVKDFSPHDLRRTLGGLLDRGVDIVTVRKLAGHASVTTTEHYNRRTEQGKQ